MNKSLSLKLISFYNQNETPILAAVTYFLIMTPEIALAGDAQGLFTSNALKTGMKAAFLIGAGVKWIDYFASWSPDGAIKNAITPALLTYLGFQYDTVMSWFFGTGSKS